MEIHRSEAANERQWKPDKLGADRRKEAAATQRKKTNREEENQGGTIYVADSERRQKKLQRQSVFSKIIIHCVLMTY